MMAFMVVCVCVRAFVSECTYACIYVRIMTSVIAALRWKLFRQPYDRHPRPTWKELSLYVLIRPLSH